MTSHDDILERLATANPVARDAPPDDDQERAAQRVLERVLAQPRTEPAPAAGREGRRRPRFALVGAAAGLAALGAVLVVAFTGGGRSIDPAAEAFAAATGDGGVLHTVSTVTERVEGGAPTRAILESWFAADGSRSRTLQYDVRAGSVRGRLVAEGVDGPRNLTVSYADPRDDGPIYSGREAGAPGRSYDPLAEYRRMYRSGRVRSEGRAEVDGRDVWRLAVSVRRSPMRNVSVDERGRRSVRTVPARTDRYVYFVDAGTYLPVLVREDTLVGTEKGRGFQRTQTSERFATFERLTGSAAERHLEPSERFRKR